MGLTFVRNLTLAIPFFVASGCVASKHSASVYEEESPFLQAMGIWASKSSDELGYEIDVISANPRPGTVLQSGQDVEFSVEADYNLAVKEAGRVVMIFQVGNESIEGTVPQEFRHVSRGAGRVSVSRIVRIPENVGMISLFIQLQPDGYTETTGEARLMYPVSQVKAPRQAR